MPTLTEEGLEGRRRAIVERYGPWTAHNVRLGESVYTMQHHAGGNEFRARRILQIVSDAVNRPIESLRVLDLGALEGLFAIEFALHGAEVLAIEAREESVAKARFAKDALGLERLEIVQDDVRNLSRARHGTADVVLCLGLLYHLDAPDCFRFLERLAEVCTRLLVLDTHVSPDGPVGCTHGGHPYRGRRIIEHREASTEAQRRELPWASLDNPRSFWPTRSSLLNALASCGFTSVHERLNPAVPDHPVDRVEWLAFRGDRVRLRSTPFTEGTADPAWPERVPARRSAALRWTYRWKFLKSEAVRALPRPVKRALRTLLRR